MLMIIMLSLRLMTIPGDDLYHNCRCHHSSLTDVQTAATAVTDHHTDDELVHNVNRVKWHNNCNGDEVDTIVLMKTIKTIYSVPTGPSVAIIEVDLFQLIYQGYLRYILCKYKGHIS